MYTKVILVLLLLAAPALAQNYKIVLPCDQITVNDATHTIKCKFIEPVSTPTPKPAPTATPIAFVCNQGNVPKYTRPGFEDWYGFDSKGIAPGEEQTWCFSWNQIGNRLVMNIGDNTGTAQCFQHFAEYIPPEGSSLGTVRYGNPLDPLHYPPVTNSGNTFLVSPGALPQGIWRLKVVAASGPDVANCNMKYQLKIHP